MVTNSEIAFLCATLIFLEVSICPIESYRQKAWSRPETEFLPVFPELPDDKYLVYSKTRSAFEEYNKELKYYNHFGALLAWNISVNISESPNLSTNFLINYLT